MTTELQNKVWSILPKEFKEEVKELYEHENKVLVQISGVTTLNEIFGFKCLQDEVVNEDNFTKLEPVIGDKKKEPKYKIGDILSNYYSDIPVITEVSNTP